MTVADFSGDAATRRIRAARRRRARRAPARHPRQRLLLRPAITDDPRKEPCAELRFSMKPYQPPAGIPPPTSASTRPSATSRPPRIEAQVIRETQKAGLTGMAYVANECRKQGETCKLAFTILNGEAAVAVPAAAAPDRK
jgi:hypothetical protein